MNGRQWSALCRAWDAQLYDWVTCHGDGLYTVPSQSEPGQYHAIQYWPLAGSGYIYTCTCRASEKGGVVCRHVCAVHLWRLAFRFGWRLKAPKESIRAG